jgi:hypothetical protein
VSNAGELVRYVHQTAPGLDETDAACRLSAAAHERFRARSEEPGTMRGVGTKRAGCQQRSVKPFDAWEPVESGIEGHNSPDIMLLHDGQMDGVARRQVPMAQDDGFCSINRPEVNGKDIIDQS